MLWPMMQMFDLYGDDLFRQYIMRTAIIYKSFNL